MKLFENLNRRVNQLLTGTVIPESTDAPTQPEDASTPTAQTPTPQAQPSQAAGRYEGPWKLSDTLLHFQTINVQGKRDRIPFSFANSFEGSFVFGGVGSGKTSGSGRTFAASFLRKGFGGLVLCVKADEAQTWVKYAKENGREDDLILFNEQTRIITDEDEESSDEKQPADAPRKKKTKPACFNFLDYELRHSQGNPAESACGVLMELVGANAASDSKNAMWERASRRLLRSTLEACRLAGEEPSLAKMYQLATDPDFAEAMLKTATARKDATPSELNPSQQADLGNVKAYFESEWKNMAAETRGSIMMNMTGVCDPFMSGSLRDMFTGVSTVTPEDIFAGKIVVVDLPTLRFYEAGRVAAIAWKYCFQRAVQRRIMDDSIRPTFLYADESQNIITTGDGVFVETSRSSRCATVFLTQNRPNLLARMSKERVDSMLGNFQTKVLHQNGDPETNTWAADVISRDYQTRASTSANYSNDRSKAQDQGGGSTSYQQQLEHQLLPVEFLRLAKGGDGEFNKIVTAYLFQSGRNFPTANNLSYALIGFQQTEAVPH